MSGNDDKVLMMMTMLMIMTMIRDWGLGEQG